MNLGLNTFLIEISKQLISALNTEHVQMINMANTRAALGRLNEFPQSSKSSVIVKGIGNPLQGKRQSKPTYSGASSRAEL